MNSSPLTNRHALVTGAGSGIGAAIAAALAQAGAKVSLVGRRLEPLQMTAAQLGNANAHAISGDVTDATSVDDCFAAAETQFGPVHILVNNAGAAPSAAFHKMTAQLWRDVMAVNLDGTFFCSQRALAPMLEFGWGRIVNIASTAALKGYANHVSAYCAAKHGVLGLTRALALETASHGITVNAICPGFTNTEIIRSAVHAIAAKTGRNEQYVLKTFVNTNPQGRLVEPAEVAASVLWLCSPGAESLTGQAIAVCGGEVM
jgi:NAD(P)-dependent dehydrogenase (short-subunit alcohol dehydrogenase family)